MKRIFCGLLCLILCFSLFGCEKAEEPIPMKEPVTFFYLRNDFDYTNTDSVIGSEPREAAGHKDDLAYLMEQYFKGPLSENLANTFPANCGLVSFSTRSSTITVVITDSLATLSGTDLTIACVCLAKTITGITGYPKVVIRTQTQLLNGKGSITIRDGEPALFDDYIAPTTTE